MEYLVRTALPDDAQAILEARYSAIHHLGRQFYSEEVCSKWGSPMTQEQIERFQRSILKEENITFVAESAAKILGFSRLTLPNTISAVYVAFEYMRYGIGAALLNQLEAYARHNHIPLLTLDSSLSAEKFYLKHGYQVTGRGSHRLNSGAEMMAVYMEKKFD